MYLGEIRMFAGSFAPAGWMFCEGQLLPISENDALFNLIGTTYGGDGESTFGLPDLRGRIPIHQGTCSGNGITYTVAQTGGVEDVTLTAAQMPAHAHPLSCSSKPGNQRSPVGNVWAAPAVGEPYYSDGTGSLSLQPLPLQGGSQPHGNMSPYLCVNFIISLFGVFPSQT